MSADAEAEGRLRIDRWLWFARFFKSRSGAARLCTGKRIRVNGQVVAKPSHQLGVGDVLTFPQGRTIRTIKVAALGKRRGPAVEAAELYEDMAPPTKTAPEARARGPFEALPARRDRGAGRPTKAERRAMDKWRGDPK